LAATETSSVMVVAVSATALLIAFFKIGKPAPRRG
jgi:hypothetical protein